MTSVRDAASAFFGALLAMSSCKRNPPPQRILEQPGSIIAAAADATHFYFVISDGTPPFAKIARLPIGGTALQILTGDTRAVLGIALSGDTIYWTTETLELKRAPKSGGEPTLVAKGVAPPIVADDGAVYGLVERDASGGRHVVAYALKDNGARVLSEHSGDLLVADAEAVYLASSLLGKQIERIPKDGSAPTIVATLSHSGPIALMGDEVYFRDDNLLYRVSKRGGERHLVGISSGDDLLAVGGKLYGAVESASTGSTAYQKGSIREVSASTPRTIFEGRLAHAMVGVGDDLYFAGAGAKERITSWFKAGR